MRQNRFFSTLRAFKGPALFILFLIFTPLVSGASEEPKKEGEHTWRPLFDGKTTDDWDIPSIGGEGLVEVKDGVMSIGMGVSISGIRYKKDFPKLDYEIRYEARRGMGHDFFGALTFPVGNAHCTFINGGWGGGTIGLSCVDGYDASDNPTSGYYYFDSRFWYEFRVRVTEGKIVVWIKKLEAAKGKEPSPSERTSTRKEPDPNEPVVDLVIDGRKISLRNETDDFKPIGFATWITEGLIRKIEYRNLTPEEIVQSKKEADEYSNRFIRSN